MKFFIYSRKSVTTGKGDSVENQVQMCKAYIRARFEGVCEEDFFVYEEEGFSGKSVARPGFQKMLGDITVQKPDYIVCYRLDRISRSVSDFAWLIEMLNQKEISFLCIKEEFDTARPMGKAMMYMASVFAQLERETIAERVRDNMQMLARGGKWLGGTPPLGFCSEKTMEVYLDGKVKTAYHLKVNEGELVIVKYMFHLFLETGSLSALCHGLTEERIKTRQGKPYSLQSCKLILQNPVYATADPAAWDYFTQKGAEVCFPFADTNKKRGIIAYNKRDYRKKHAPRQGEEKWIIALGKHKGVISGEDWIKVQRLLQRGGEKRRMLVIHNDYALLSGLITCKICGGFMTAKRRGSLENEVFDYICSRKRAAGKGACDCKNLQGVKADDQVLQTLGLGGFGGSLAEKRQKVTAEIQGVFWDGSTLEIERQGKNTIA